VEFLIERWVEEAGEYLNPAFGTGTAPEPGGDPVPSAFEDAEITMTGCYRVRPKADPEAAPVYYSMTLTGVERRDVPCM